MRDAGKMKIVLKDILLMDRGTSAYTSFDWDEDVVAYQMDNPQVLDEGWLIGHIHSHNTMGVFFSGTDWSELNDNCPQHNFYLSVIVNNYHEILAKIAFTAEPKSFSCKDETGKDYVLKLTKSSLEPMMFVYDCEEVDAKQELLVVPESFTQRLSTVGEKVKIKMEAEAARKKEWEKKNSKITNPAVTQQQDLYKNYKNGKSPFPDYTPKRVTDLDQLEAEMEAELTEGLENLQTLEQEFATYLLRLGNNEDVIDDEIVDALEDIEEEVLTNKLFAHSFAESIVQSYGALHDRFFDKIDKWKGDDKFMEMLGSVIEEFESHEADYTFLEPIIAQLKSMGNKFEFFIKENQDKQWKL